MTAGICAGFVPVAREQIVIPDELEIRADPVPVKLPVTRVEPVMGVGPGRPGAAGLLTVVDTSVVGGRRDR